jgi:hypothetical protein
MGHDCSSKHVFYQCAPICSCAKLCTFTLKRNNDWACMQELRLKSCRKGLPVTLRSFSSLCSHAEISLGYKQCCANLISPPLQHTYTPRVFWCQQQESHTSSHTSQMWQEKSFSAHTHTHTCTHAHTHTHTHTHKHQYTNNQNKCQCINLVSSNNNTYAHTLNMFFHITQATSDVKE